MARELLLVTAYISDLIEKDEIATIRETMKQNSEADMRRFDQARLFCQRRKGLRRSLWIRQ